MRFTARLLIFILLVCSTAAADRAIRAQAQKECSAMEENVNVNISFNAQLPTPLQAKERFDSRLKEIEGLARDGKIKKWSLQSMNYSVSSSNYGYGEPTYQLSGSASYQTDNADQAFALMEQFSKRGLQLSVSVSKYRSGGDCPAAE